MSHSIHHPHVSHTSFLDRIDPVAFATAFAGIVAISWLAYAL